MKPVSTDSENGYADLEIDNSDDSNDEVFLGLPQKKPANVEIINLETHKETKKHSGSSKRHFVFHIIINTNKSKNNMELPEYESIWNKLSVGARKFFETYFFQLYTLYDVKNPGPMADVPLEDRIISGPKITYTREIGPTRGLIHLHCCVRFTVRALRIKLNIQGIEKTWGKMLGLNGVHCCIKLYRDASGTLVDYMRKSLIDSY